jgi:hypothetical protein
LLTILFTFFVFWVEFQRYCGGGGGGGGCCWVVVVLFVVVVSVVLVLVVVEKGGRGLFYSVSASGGRFDQSSERRRTHGLEI